MTDNGIIKKILRVTNKDGQVQVHVQLEDGLKGVVWVGVGAKVRVYHDALHDKIKCHITWKA